MEQRAKAKSRPWRMLLPLIIVMVLAVLWCVYWIVASSAIKAAYAEGERRLAAHDIALTCTSVQWGGFPFRVERSCSVPHLAVADLRAQMEASAANLMLVIQAYDPRHVIALLDGPTRIKPADHPPIDLTHERALASLRGTSEENWQASLEIPKLAAGNLGSSQNLLLHARMTGSPTLDVALEADGVDTSAINAVPLTIDALAVMASLPKDAIRQNIAGYLAQTGSEVALTQFSLRQGEMTITGSGNIGLDPEFYPTGRVTTKITRIDLLFATVKQIAKLSDDDTKTAQTIITLLQKSNATSQIDLVAKDRKLYWGPFKLADLQPVF